MKILILDDERLGVQNLHDSLSNQHHIVWERSIHDAMKTIDAENFDLIVCGTHLINESMFEFLRAVRDEAANKKIPFVCFRAGDSAFAKASDDQIEYTSNLLGANGYVVANDKTNPDDLRTEVEKLVRDFQRHKKAK